MKRLYLLLVLLFPAFILSFSQNIGAGQPNPAAKVDVNGNLIIGANLSGTLSNAHVNGASVEGQSTFGTDVTIRTYELLRSNSYAGFRDAINGYTDIAIGIGVFGRSIEYRGGEFQSRGDYINDGAAGLMAFNDHHANGVAGLFQTEISQTTSLRSQNFFDGTGQSWLTTNDFDLHTSAGTFIGSSIEGTALFAFADGDGLEGTGAAVLGVSSLSDPVVGITPAEHIAGVVGKNITAGPTRTNLLTIGILGLIESDYGDFTSAVVGEIRAAGSEGAVVLGRFEDPVDPNSDATGGQFNLGYTNKMRNPFIDGTVAVRGSGIECGIYGYAQADGSGYGSGGPITPIYNTVFGGEFESTNQFTFADVGVGLCSGGTSYKIADLVGAGSVVSTARKGADGKNKILFAPEAPSPMYEDYGHGQLENGRTKVSIDPDLQKMIYVSQDKPLKVFVQLEGDCKGVYVTNKTTEGFEVIELQGGQSNVSFTYQLIAHAADVELNGQVVNQLQELRFPDLPDKKIADMATYRATATNKKMGRGNDDPNIKIVSPNPEAFKDIQIRKIQPKH